jgi:hypothetical protein
MCENHAKCVQINKKPLDGTAELICTGAKSWLISMLRPLVSSLLGKVSFISYYSSTYAGLPTPLGGETFGGGDYRGGENSYDWWQWSYDFNVLTFDSQNIENHMVDNVKSI